MWGWVYERNSATLVTRGKNIKYRDAEMDTGNKNYTRFWREGFLQTGLYNKKFWEELIRLISLHKSFIWSKVKQYRYTPWRRLGGEKI
jgi:ribonuclease HI